MDTLSLGVIGCGVIGKTHIQAAKESPLIDLVAIADVNHQAAQEVASQVGVQTVYDSAERLMADDQIDAVVLALPAGIRTALALKALASGKHVLLEKPVAVNAQEVEQMLLAKGDRVVACCSARYRFLESAKAATAFIAKGSLGDIRLVRCQVSQPIGPVPEKLPPAWRLNRSLNGGGIMSNWGCYDLDYLLGITGWRIVPKMIFAKTWKIADCFESYVAPGSDAETHFTAIIQCESDITITIDRGEYLPIRHEQSWQIIGTRGSLRLIMTSNNEADDTIELDQATPTGLHTTTIWKGKNDHHTLIHGPVTDFAHSILNGHQPMTSLSQAVTLAKITDAIYASSESMMPISITQ